MREEVKRVAELRRCVTWASLSSPNEVRDRGVRRAASCARTPPGHSHRLQPQPTTWHDASSPRVPLSCHIVAVHVVCYSLSPTANAFTVLWLLLHLACNSQSKRRRSHLHSSFLWRPLEPTCLSRNNGHWYCTI